MIFYLIWILVSAPTSKGSGGCSTCGGKGHSSSHASGKYPSWFPVSGYDKTYNPGYDPKGFSQPSAGGYQSQYPSGYDTKGYQQYPSSYDTKGYSQQYPSTYDTKGYSQQYPTGYDKGTSGYYPPSSYDKGTMYNPPIDKRYYGQQGYDTNGPKMYDTGFNGYQQGWYEKGSNRYPGTDRVDYLDDDRSNVYARKGYKGDQGGYHRVKKQSTGQADGKAT